MALKSGGPVLFVATAEAGDEDMKERIKRHRLNRPADWRTLEVTTHLGRHITQNTGKARTVIIDCVTLLVSNVFQEYEGVTDAALLEKAVVAEIEGLIKCIKRSDARFIIVTNEVGLGIVPAERVSRLYRDFLGMANRLLAENADEVIFMAAGIPVTIKNDRNV
jgi:adenosylcobinamide kinase/adenosylcobinamide-phosphate guanylyltransferase